MALDTSDPAVKEAVQQACLELGLPLVYRMSVGLMVATPRAEWPVCCGDGCYPCTDTLQEAALRTYELLGRSPA